MGAGLRLAAQGLAFYHRRDSDTVLSDGSTGRGAGGCEVAVRHLARAYCNVYGSVLRPGMLQGLHHLFAPYCLYLGSACTTSPGPIVFFDHAKMVDTTKWPPSRIPLRGPKLAAAAA